MARRYWKKMRDEAAAGRPSEPRPAGDNPWQEDAPLSRLWEAPPIEGRTEAYTEWAERLRQKAEERRGELDPPTPDASHWSTEALFAESRRIEHEERGTRANPWMVRDLLAVLDLREGATRDEIGSAYRKLAKLHHPDRFLDADEDTREFHATRMRAIIEAYRALRDTQPQG